MAWLFSSLLLYKLLTSQHFLRGVQHRVLCKHIISQKLLCLRLLGITYLFSNVNASCTIVSRPFLQRQWLMHRSQLLQIHDLSDANHIHLKKNVKNLKKVKSESQSSIIFEKSCLIFLTITIMSTKTAALSLRYNSLSAIH